MTSRSARSFVLVLTFLLTLCVFPVGSRAAGPALSLSVTHSPETFMRGDYTAKFLFTVTNTGDEPTSGSVELEPSIPAGLAVRGFRASSAGENEFPCPTVQELQEGVPLVCEHTEPLQAGQAATEAIVVFVEAGAPDSVTATGLVSAAGVGDANGTDTALVIDRPPFQIQDFSAHASDEAGADYKVAGGHPFKGTSNFAVPIFHGFPAPVGDVRNVFVKLPPGFIGAVPAFETCTIAQLTGNIFPACPEGSQVGEVEISLSGSPSRVKLYNVVPEKGFPAEFGFNFLSKAIVFYPFVRPRSEGYGFTFGSPGVGSFFVTGIGVELFGIPSLHDNSGGPPIPFLSNPLDCSDATPTTMLAIDSWQSPARRLTDGLPDLSDPNWKTATVTNPQVEGCSDPALASQWNPTISTIPIQEGPVQANSPSGLNVRLQFDQSNDATDPAYISGLRQYDPTIPQAPELKTATVTLPDGMAISPSGANGLGACSDRASATEGDQVDYDNTIPVTCPDSSKIGTVTATSPLLAKRDPTTDEVTGPEPLSGDVYILAPHPGDLPAGGEGDGRYRLLIQVENEELGVNFKLPGIAVANQNTGQLTATFTENPQLPVKNLELEFFKGERAALSTPKTCGTFITTTDLEAWSAPGTPDAHPQSSFQIGDGSGCASSLGARPFNPSLSAGTTSSKAGSSAPFVLNLSRGDNEQEFSSLDVNLPPGLTAKLAGVPYCPEGAIAAAKSKSGAAEEASASCPAASQVGTATVSAGPGRNPYTVSGKAYLAGPYKGAPLSFVFVTPAVAGPFDLGNVVVRAAAFVNPETTQVTVKTDPIPQILDGVPLGIRSIQVNVDKPDFTLNPTDCEPMAVGVQVGGSSGASASPANHFQAGDCGALAFKPALKISLKGSTGHTGHPALKAVVTYPQQGAYANIARAQVNLPHSEFLDQGSLNKTCTKPVLLEGKCPAKTIYGKAKAWTPLLAAPLEGPVYLVGGYGFKLPALVAELNGQIRVVLKGKVDSGPNKGIRNTFEAVPDAPVSRFVLEMKGGKKYGLLENSEDLCKKPQRAIANFTAQNGLVDQTKPLVANSCGKKKAKAKHHKGHKKHRGH
jgi:hypothetical protein